MLPFMMLPLVSGERLGEVDERPSLRLKLVLNWCGRVALLRCSTPGLRIPLSLHQPAARSTLHTKYQSIEGKTIQHNIHG